MSISVNESGARRTDFRLGPAFGFFARDTALRLAALALRWTGVIAFAGLLALFSAATGLLLSITELGTLRWEIVGLLGMAALALGHSLVSVRVDPPAGQRIGREEAPRLWSVVDEICHSAGVSAPIAILLVDDNNAAAANVPRRGLSPRSDTYLLLGLPLLLALGPGQARAVIAHEIGHFSRRHGESGLEVKKALAIAAGVVRQARESGNFALRVLAAFYGAAGARLSAASIQITREQEFQADCFAGEVAGAGAAAEALIVLALADKMIGETGCLLAEERSLLERGRPAADTAAALEFALAQPAGPHSSHPSLGDRIAALGQSPRAPAPVGAGHAAAAWFDNLDQLIAGFDVERSKWLSLRDAAVLDMRSAAAERLRANLNSRESAKGDAAACPLQQAEALLDRAHDALAIDDIGLASEFAERAFSFAPNYSRGHVAIGTIKTRRGDPAGLGDLVRAVELDPRRAWHAFQTADEFLRHRPAVPGGQQSHARLAMLSEAAAVAARERESEPRLAEIFVAADLPPNAAAAIRGALAAEPDLLGFTLVRRMMREWSDLPAWLATAELRGGWNGAADSGSAHRILSTILATIGVYGTINVMNPRTWAEKTIAARMARTDGAWRWNRDAHPISTWGGIEPFVGTGYSSAAPGLGAQDIHPWPRTQPDPCRAS